MRRGGGWGPRSYAQVADKGGGGWRGGGAGERRGGGTGERQGGQGQGGTKGDPKTCLSNYAYMRASKYDFYSDLRSRSGPKGLCILVQTSL